MEQQNKDLLVINPVTANILIQAGCKIKRIGKNNQAPERSVFYFENTEEARTILETYIKMSKDK
jgi:hypothetical protein